MSPPEPAEVDACDALELERCTCHICLEPVEESDGQAFHQPRDKNGPGVRTPCGVCRGPELGAVHLACLRNDMLHNNRIRCSVCHTRFAFRTVSRSLSRLERLSNAVQLHKRWLLRVTAGCLCVCALCAVFFSLLQLHVLPTEQFARDGVFLVGAGALFVLLGCWRYVLAVQPSVDSVRVLLSAPEGDKGRRPLMQFVSGDAVAVPVASTPRTHFLTWLGLMPAAPALPPWLDNGGEALEPPSASTTADLSLQREWALHRALDSAASAFDLTDMMRYQRPQQLALATDVESGSAPLAPDQQ